MLLGLFTKIIHIILERKSFLFLLSACLFISTVIAVDKKEGVSRECSIRAAKMAKEAYQYSQFGYFIKDDKTITKNIEGALKSINLSISAIDSAIFLASKDSSNLIAIDYATISKQYGQAARKFLEKAAATDDIMYKRLYCKKAIYICGNAIVDAYNASLYFNSLGDNTPAPVNIDKNKPLTKLEVDRALFNILNEDLKRREESIIKEMNDLKQKLSSTTNPAEQAKIKKQIQELEAKLAEVQVKKKEIQDKYNNIDGLIKTEKDTKEQDDIFSKSVKKGAFDNNNDEWGSALILDQQLPPGLFYKIQVGVYKSKLDPAVFQGLTPITGETTEGGIRYSAGLFTKLKDAQEAKNYINSIGFNDAFVVAYYNGAKIAIAEASKLEK